MDRPGFRNCSTERPCDSTVRRAPARDQAVLIGVHRGHDAVQVVGKPDAAVGTDRVILKDIEIPGSPFVDRAARGSTPGTYGDRTRRGPDGYTLAKSLFNAVPGLAAIGGPPQGLARC